MNDIPIHAINWADLTLTLKYYCDAQNHNTIVIPAGMNEAEERIIKKES